MVGKPAICCFVAIEKRHIAAALLLCPEDGTGAVQLSVVLSLAGNNGCSNGCTTADQHKDNQQSRVACVAGLWNGVLRCGRCSRCLCGLCCLVSVLVLQGSKGIFLFFIAENALLSLTDFAICCKYPSSDGNSIDISIIKLDLSNNLYFVQNNQYCSVYRVVLLYV